MKQFDDLINGYALSGMDSAGVAAWYAKNSPSADTISALAENVGASFLSGHISFNVANALLNDLMPLVGFESAPKRFWQYYVAFENSETSNDPDSHAKPAVAALTTMGAA